MPDSKDQKNIPPHAAADRFVLPSKTAALQYDAEKLVRVFSACVSTDAVSINGGKLIVQLCRDIIENQVRQGIEISVLREQLAAIEKELAPKVLDKSPLRPSSPAVPK